MYRSDIYQSMNQPDLAAADLEQAALRITKDPIAYMGLGKLYFRMQQYDKARAELYKLTGEKALATKDLLKSKDRTLDLLDEFR